MAANSTPAGGPQASGHKLDIPLFERVSRKEITAVCRELSVLIDVGQPLLKALRILAARQTNTKLAKLLNDTAEQVEQGNTLSSSLEKHPQLFSPLFLSIVRVGEESGSLDLALRRLSDFLEQDLRNRNRLVANLIYPVMAIVTMLVVIVLVSLLVLPKFKEMFEGRAEMPFISEMVFGFGDFLVSAWWFLLIVLIGGAIGLRLFRGTAAGKRFFDTLVLRFPGIRGLGVKVVTVRFAESLSILIKSGIPLVRGLKILGRVSDNVVVADIFARSTEEVEKGRPLAESLREANVFPPLVIDMVSIGDEAGALDVVLDKVADNYNEQVNLFLDTFTSLLEPVLIIVLGGVALILAVAIYLPLWETSQQALDF